MKIAGGTARGRILQTPPGRQTRPTSAVVREAVFGILAAQTQDAWVLDLFGGSGAMACEAVSRGAAHAVIVDADAQAVRVARENVRTLGMEQQIEVYRNDAFRAMVILQKKGMRFDWVYIDPPYASGLYEKAILAAYPAVCKPEGVLICEHAANEPLPERIGSCIRTDTRRYGIRALSLYKGAEK